MVTTPAMWRDLKERNHCKNGFLRKRGLKMLQKKLLIIDGNSILNRAYYGIRMLNAPDGTPTNAVYGFLNIFFKNLDEQRYDYVCVAFDVKEKTFRHKMYDAYKAQRKPAPEDFLVQLPLMKEVLSAMGVCCLEKPGYEADDIIGTVSRLCENSKIECNILTGDKDDLQLASDAVKIHLVITRMGSTATTVYGADEVFEKYSVTPSEYIDVKALMGDTSDNIPGVKGIGEKTAFSLIEKYKSLDRIYDEIESIEVTPSVRKKLTEGKNSAYLSRTLAIIDREVPMDFDFEACRAQLQGGAELKNLFIRLNFKSFLKRAELISGGKNGANGTNGKNGANSTNGTNGSTAENGASAEKGESCAAEHSFDGVCRRADRSELGALISKSESLVYRLYRSENALAVTADGENFLYVDKADDEVLRLFFENADCKKIGFDTKDDILFLKEKGIEYLGAGADAAIAAYILEPTRSSYDIDSLALEFLGLLPPKAANEDESGQISLLFDDEGADSDVLSRAAADIYAIYALWQGFAAELEENGQHKLYYDIELPLVKVLADMQYTGVAVDRGALEEFGKRLSGGIAELENSIYELAGEKFNINSPKQLGSILFERLGLKHGKKTKTGYSTNVDVLRKLENEHPIIGCILEYRSLTKLRSTYVDGLLAVISPKTGRIHSNFNQTVTATGRISSTEPNLQNIPVRTERGREMRRMFTAGENRVLVDADYSQIELRVLAHIAGDENMRNAFLSGADIHTQTAAQVFHVPPEEVTGFMRTSAKAVNFGIVYGIGEFSLAQDLKISMKEAKQYIADYLATYPAIKAYMENTVRFGRENGYVATIFNRRRYLPELRAANKITQAFGERVAMNAPVQGSAADIIKIAMVNVYSRLKKEGLKSKLILQIHDELIVETEPNELDAVKKILSEEMENAAQLSVPLKVDMNSGKTWYDTK